MSQVATNPARRAGFGPVRELRATISALSELGALLEPFGPMAAAAGSATATSDVPPPPSGAPRRADADRMAGRPVDAPVPPVEPGREWAPLRSLRRPANIAFAVVLVAVMSVWWVALRPATLGGSATFITVRGTSMLPTLKTGDFVLAEAQASYHVGDLVVYRVPQGQIGAGDDLIHRIVAGNATGGFTLKGDNNPAPDPWTVPRSDVLGKEAVVIPGLGNSLLVIRSPLFAGLIAALIAMWLVISPPGWMRRRKPAAAAEAASRREP